MTWTGRNTRDVRAWLEGDAPHQRGFIVRNAAGLTQAWSYIREDDWGADVRAAAWDETEGTWLPVRRGDAISRAADGTVTVARPQPLRV